MGCCISRSSSGVHDEGPSARSGEQGAEQNDAIAVAPSSSLLSAAPAAQQYVCGVKALGGAVSGGTDALFVRLVAAQGHLLAAVFAPHASSSCALYCQQHCWEAFVQAASSLTQGQLLAAATLRALDRGFLTSSQHSLQSRLASGCSATLVHVDYATRTLTVAAIGDYGAVALGTVEEASAAAPAPAKPAAGGSGAAQSFRQRKGARVSPRGGPEQRLADAGAREAQRRVRHAVTLEAPNAKSRDGLAALTNAVASALAASTDASGLQPPAAAASITAPAADAAAEAQVHALGFGFAKDPLLVASFGAASRTASGGGEGSAPAPLSRFAAGALGRLRCGSDVKVAVRSLAPGEECVVLLAGNSGGGAGQCVPLERSPCDVLSPPDAVTLAHELLQQEVALQPRQQRQQQQQQEPSGTPAQALNVLYDNLVPGAADAGGDCGGGAFVPAVRAAQAVAAYAASLAASRAPVVAGSAAAAAPGAACIALWLDWAARDAAAAGASVPQAASLQPTQAPPSPTAQRWGLARGYCRFLVDRRRRVLTAWRSLAAQLRAETASPLLPPLLRVPSAAALVNVMALEPGSAGAAAALAARTTSFTSRSPVLLEFEEEEAEPVAALTACGARRAPPHSAAAPAAGAATVLAAGGASAPPPPPPPAAPAAAALVAATAVDMLQDDEDSMPAPLVSGLVVAPMDSDEDDGYGPLEPSGSLPVSSALTAASSVPRPAVSGNLTPAAAPAPPSAPAAQAAADAAHAAAVQYSAAAQYSERVSPNPIHRASRSSPDLGALPLPSSGSGGVAGVGGEGEGASSDPLTRPPPQLAAAAAAAAAVAPARRAVPTRTSRPAAVIDWSLVMAPSPLAAHEAAPERASPSGLAGAASAAPQAAADAVAGPPLMPISVRSPTAVAAAAAAAGAGGSPSSSMPPGTAPPAGWPLARGAGQPVSPHAAGSSLSGVFYPRTPMATAAALGGGAAAPAAPPLSGAGGVRPLVDDSARRGTAFTSELLPPEMLRRRGNADHDPAPASSESIDSEYCSEDLPALRIESTAELAALMAEIVMTDDGEFVSADRAHGSRGFGGGLAQPKNTRPVSRQGSRGWQPRLAMVREDSREAHTSTTSIILGPDGALRFTKISEEKERASSQGSSSTAEQSQVSATLERNSNSSPEALSQAMAANASSSGASSSGAPSDPNSSEEALAAASGAGAAPAAVAESAAFSRAAHAMSSAAAAAALPVLGGLSAPRAPPLQGAPASSAAAVGRVVAPATPMAAARLHSAPASGGAPAAAPYFMTAPRDSPFLTAGRLWDTPAAAAMASAPPPPPPPPRAEPGGMEAERASAAASAQLLANVLDDLTPSTDRHRLPNDDSPAPALISTQGSGGGSGLYIGTARGGGGSGAGRRAALDDLSSEGPGLGDEVTRGSDAGSWTSHGGSAAARDSALMHERTAAYGLVVRSRSALLAARQGQAAGAGASGGGGHGLLPQLPQHLQAHRTIRNARHAYGLGEAAAASSAQASPAAAGPRARTSDNGSRSALDRSWSGGSTSGPLCSLLQTTLSKSSVTTGTGMTFTTTATPVPCTSAQGSGNRLPSVTFGQQEVAATAAAAAAAAAITAVHASPATPLAGGRALPRSLSSSRPPQSCLSQGSLHVQAGAASPAGGALVPAADEPAGVEGGIAVRLSPSAANARPPWGQALPASVAYPAGIALPRNVQQGSASAGGGWEAQGAGGHAVRGAAGGAQRSDAPGTEVPAGSAAQLLLQQQHQQQQHAAMLRAPAPVSADETVALPSSPFIRGRGYLGSDAGSWVTSASACASSLRVTDSMHVGSPMSHIRVGAAAHNAIGMVVGCNHASSVRLDDRGPATPSGHVPGVGTSACAGGGGDMMSGMVLGAYGSVSGLLMTSGDVGAHGSSTALLLQHVAGGAAHAPASCTGVGTMLFGNAAAPQRPAQPLVRQQDRDQEQRSIDPAPPAVAAASQLQLQPRQSLHAQAEATPLPLHVLRGQQPLIGILHAKKDAYSGAAAINSGGSTNAASALMLVQSAADSASINLPFPPGRSSAPNAPPSAVNVSTLLMGNASSPSASQPGLREGAFSARGHEGGMGA